MGFVRGPLPLLGVTNGQERSSGLGAGFVRPANSPAWGSRLAIGRGGLKTTP
jgi:hypothetical protein